MKIIVEYIVGPVPVPGRDRVSCACPVPRIAHIFMKSMPYGHGHRDQRLTSDIRLSFHYRTVLRATVVYTVMYRMSINCHWTFALSCALCVCLCILCDRLPLFVIFKCIQMNKCAYKSNEIARLRGCLCSVASRRSSTVQYCM
jgi:hypothetical protein